MDTLPNELTRIIYSYVNPPTIDLRIANALDRFKLQVKHLFREKIENCFDDADSNARSFKTLGPSFDDRHTTFTYGRTIRTCLWRTDCLVGLNLFKCFLSI